MWLNYNAQLIKIGQLDWWEPTSPLHKNSCYEWLKTMLQVRITVVGTSGSGKTSLGVSKYNITIPLFQA